MGKWGVENQICVKIIIYKGCNDGEVIYYRNKLPLWMCYNNRFATLAYWIFTLVGTGGPALWHRPFPDR